MQPRVSIYVYADDPILQAGMVSQLRGRPEIDIVEASELARAQLGVVAADALDDETLRIMRSLKRAGVAHTVLVMRAIDDAAVVSAAEVGVSGLLRRSEATPETLVRTIQKVAQGDGVIPSDLLGHLLGQVGRLQRQVLSPRGLTFTGLSDREIEVLRLIADGNSNKQIADMLRITEDTVKGRVRSILSKLGANDRTHAATIGLKRGIIHLL